MVDLRKENDIESEPLTWQQIQYAATGYLKIIGNIVGLSGQCPTAVQRLIMIRNMLNGIDFNKEQFETIPDLHSFELKEEDE